MTAKIITVDFRQDVLFAVERDDGVFVAVKPISEALGLKWHGQWERLNRDTILSEGIRVMGIPSVGGVQETVCLRLDLVNGWLFGIANGRDALAKLDQDERGVASTDTLGGRQDVNTVSEFGIPSACQLWFKLGLPVVPAMLHDPRQGNLMDFTNVKTDGANGTNGGPH